MEQNTDTNLEFKNKVINFYNSNKSKFIFLIIILLATVGIFSFINYNNEKKNILISEKYTQANIYLSTDQSEKAKKFYEDIILSKNKFYSILALNIIIEKNLITDKNKILEYFQILEKSITNENNKDLIALKKALYLIKKSDLKKGNQILNDLINKNSMLKSIAEEFLKN